MLAQTPNLLLDLLFVVTVSHFKGGLALPHILTPTSTTGSKVDYKTASAIQFLFDLICSASVGALECYPLLNNRAGNPAFLALSTSRVFFTRF